MQLDKMKKADLVDLTRKLRQELKSLKKTQDTKESGDLPLVALSQVRINGVDKIVILHYNIETGDAKVVDIEDQMNKHLSNLKFDESVLEYLDQQIVEDKND